MPVFPDDTTERPRGRLAARLAILDARWPGGRRRFAGLAAALLLEAGLFLLLLTLGLEGSGGQIERETLSTFSAEPEAEPADEPERERAKPTEPSPPAAELPRAEPVTSAAPIAAPVPAPLQPPVGPPAKAEVPSTPAPGIKAVIRPGGPMGPTGTGASPGDSERISGSGPNGEPLYAARWYREPSDDELRGYLSTAGGPGWALINCRTVPDFRVEDCYLVSEYPTGLQLGRAVLAAAWQFRVRPPRVGGRSMVGEWVRIRIVYTMQRQ